MFKSEKGNVYINWLVGIIAGLILLLLFLKVLLGPTGLIEQKKEEKVRNSTEKNIMIQLMDENEDY